MIVFCYIFLGSRTAEAGETSNALGDILTIPAYFVNLHGAAPFLQQMKYSILTILYSTSSFAGF